MGGRVEEGGRVLVWNLEGLEVCTECCLGLGLKMGWCEVFFCPENVFFGTF